ncbi:MAG: phosphoenolpyruvate hydrolase family protein [Candidatus Abyssobacteria bacterium SURF_5]|uniref:Phosphoenolpyruvate hydrolase family protein n=1 Tax=Abyssobacteria bacterium (strain SURF_5) TaxID=2093360 RepID=A0A3A4P0M1_ABYX5|nr:MAG: phosphoenolpyruvate hydrolase family protein [Candidatus Abyssubacteria bacterium SURF_5]
MSRQEILNRLNHEIGAKKPIFGAGCSAGIIAKCAEVGQADLIIVYSTGKTRMMGLPTTIIGPSNSITLEMADELMNVVKNVPIIAGVEANDIYCLDLEKSVERFLNKGFSGVINFPTVGLYENLIEGGMALRKFTEYMAPGYGVEQWGWPREVEMIRLLRSRDVFTMAYVFIPSDAADMARAGVDVICVHVGPTMGGLAGFKEIEDLDALLGKAQETIEAARRERSDVICLMHGGPFADPQSTAVIYERTDAQGFVGASAVERTPIERAVIETCRGFKDHRIGGRK